MPLDKFVLILVCVLAAAGLTVWLAALISATTVMPGLGLAIMVPVGLVLYVLWRVIARRLNNAEDDHYDRIEK